MDVDQILSLPIEKKIGQLFFIGIPGPEIEDRTARLLNDISPGGVCLFARNIREASQTRELLQALRERLPAEPFLSLDQEGGLVDRLRRILTPMPAADKIRSAEDARRLAEIIAESIGSLGFNMDFAPVVDISGPGRRQYSNGLVSRTFGDSKEEVAELAGEFLRELQLRGIIGCVKHFPGLGASQVDSHDELPLVNISPDEFESEDLYPYRKLLGENIVHAIMVAHAAYPKLHLQETDQSGKLLPSSLSRSVVTGLLREQLGYDGLVITDDVEMGAILKNYGIGEACRLAVLAGCDMLAICAGVESIYEGFEAIRNAVRSGEIAEDRLNQSLRRISAVRAMLQPPLPFDLSRLNALSADIAELNARLTL